MSIKEEDLCGVLCCIHLVHDVDLWWVVVNMVIGLWVSSKAEKFEIAKHL